MKLSVLCLFCVIIPSWTQDYCWPNDIQVCRLFLVSSLYSCHSFGSVRIFWIWILHVNFVGVWNCRNWKSQPSSKFKICNFPCHPCHLHFTLGEFKTPTSEQVQIEILLEEIVFVSLLAYCGAGTLETHLNIPPGQLIGSRSQMVSYECPLEDTAGWIKAILIKVPL